MNAVDSFIIAGTKGSILMNPAFMFDSGLEQKRTVGKHKSHETFKHTDQFGGQDEVFLGLYFETTRWSSRTAKKAWPT